MNATFHAPARPSAGRPSGVGIGTVVVLALLLLAVSLAMFAIWFQWRQTRRCLAFYGPAAARRIQAGGRVELWRLAWNDERRRPVVAERLDVSRAAGLVHLRRGLVEDANFSWDDGPGGGRLPDGAWDQALAFFDASGDSPPTVLAFELDRPQAITVVGRPGRVTMGRIARGFAVWLDATRAAARPRAPAAADLPGKSGF